MTLMTSGRKRCVASALIAIMVGDILTPAILFAGGPTQPEFGSFTASGADNMVDLFTGDFQYSIPLLQVGDHPIDLSYHSGSTMDEEASWVGLGWTLNAGAITRNVRGIPDDLHGEKIAYTQNMKKNRTIGVSSSLGVQEIFGFQPLTVGISMGASVNNYIGTSFEKGINLSLRSAQGAKTPLNGSLGLNSSSEDGLSIQPSVGLDVMHSKSGNDSRQYFGSLSIGGGFNSRQGLKQLSFGYDVIKHQGGPYATINLGTPTYTPRVGISMQNSSFTGSFRVGPGVNGTYPYAGISGYSMTQNVMAIEQERPAYGYLYTAEGSANVRAVLDFNREKDGAFTEALPALPLSGHTYDIFSVQGPGIGGSFRAFRGSFGNVFDARSGSTSTGGSLGAEVGGTHIGADIVANSVITTTGKWTSNNLALAKLGYSSANDPLHEKVYFKSAGEPTIDPEPTLFEAFGGSVAVRAKLLEPSRFLTYADQRIIGPGVNDVLPSSTRNKRIPRGQNISFLTKVEVRAHRGVHEPFAGTYQAGPSDPDDSKHIGEITTVSKEGKRYVYGLPAYNKKQKEVTFAVAGVNEASINGIVSYSGADNSINNTKGRDHFYSSTVTPPHAHSFLLTAVLSPDYVDADDERGPSEGDLGDYTTFSYTQVYSAFGWRTPSGVTKASHDPGLLADPEDDKGSYVYGEKEVWYLDKIVTRDQIAVFDYDNRTDVVSVNESGSPNSLQPLQRLLSITLYATDDYMANHLLTPEDLKPIKVVHFEYDYSLCVNVPTRNPSTGTGKLTLKKVWTTYGTSNRGNMSPYVFHYNEGGTPPCWFNPTYDMRSTDRWGNYKPNVDAPCYTDIHATVPSSPLTSLRNEYFPLRGRTKVLADRAAQAWNLQRIELPTGGLIEVDYEADAYAFVQNKEAMTMRNMVKVRYDDEDDPDACTQCPFILPGSTPAQPIERIYFQKDVGFPGSDYADVGSLVYFKVSVKDFRRAEPDVSPFTNMSDFVPGYVRVVGIDGAEADDFGYIDVAPVSLSDGGSENVSPIHLAAIQHARLNYSPFIYHKYPVDDDEPLGRQLLTGFLQSIVYPGPIARILSGTSNPNKEVVDMDIAGTVDLSKSWLRLKKPDRTKFGGGSRVKEVRITDQWNQMNTTSLPSVTYGQHYTYTTVAADGNTIISSGVAAYEPILGNDENPLRIPVTYNDEKPAAPDDKFYQEEPFGELFYPGPTVGYSEVTVRDILAEDIGRHGTGSTMHEFYTARDFPTITGRTDRPKDRDVTTFGLMSLLRVDVKDYMTATQGFSIELNDMHGKPRRTQIFQQGVGEARGDLISSEEYVYSTAPFDNGSFRLKNEAITLAPNGLLDTLQIGMDYEVVADIREAQTDVLGAGLSYNTDVVVLGAPLAVPMLLPSLNKERTRFRSIVLTKVVNRMGLLEKVIKYDKGATVSEENLVYDAETGSVLATRTINAYDRPIYSMRFPAYWYHADMAPASRNMGAFIAALPFTSGTAEITDAQKYFTPGDEVLARNVGTGVGTRMWVTSVQPDVIALIDKAGAAIANATYDLRVLRSGHKNMTDQTMATLTSLSDPLQAWGSNQYTDIIDAQAIEYTQGWRTPCECLEMAQNWSTNPYVLGRRGSWRPKRTFTYLTDRLRTDYNKNTDIRTDGRFAAFSPFYHLSDQVWQKDPVGWAFTEEIAEFGAFGQALETRNALDIPSAGMFGHRGKLQLAAGVNAKYQEIGFASFEDYERPNCHDLHFRFDDVTLIGRGHTGRRSIRVTPTSPAELSQPLIVCDNVECALDLEMTEGEDEVEVEIVGGVGPYTVDPTVVNGSGTFNPGTLPNHFTLTGTGTISVTVTDNNNCQVIRFIDVD